MHTGDECQKFWRERFAEQLEESVDRQWGVDDDKNLERAKWFNEGIRYALMIIRWDYDDETSA